MGRRKSDSDLMGLTVLALLTPGPRHAWDLHRFILDTHKDFVTGLPRRLYHAVERLHAEELITPVETTRQGRRPERTVYRLTDDGRAALGTRLRKLLETPSRDSTPFVAALSFIACLSEADARRSLVTRAAALSGAVRAAEQTIAGLKEAGLPPILLLEAKFERHRAAAELAWVESLIAGIGTGELNWADALPELPN